jgi:hypothetical protein
VPARATAHGYPQRVGPIATLRWTRRLRRHGAAVGVILTVCFAVAAHHGAWTHEDPHHGGVGTMALIEDCLGIFAATATLVAIAVGFSRLGRSRPATLLGTAGLVAPLSLDLPLPRAGPSASRLLCVVRR